MNDTDVSDRPKWLLELENRKRKPRLAHEAGAGAPCVLCKAACPGLDLHFWRKICKNCKCSKDDHDVDDDDFPQFDLLFGTSRKYKKKSILLRINNEKEHVGEAFEWVPDTTKELAADYMKALPVEKLPIKGSPGAALRRQLLQKQLPLHDIDYKTCDKLSDQEKKQFERYLENIKRYVGQGTVTKILSARPFDGSLITPVNATDMQHLSPQNKPNVPSSFIQLRTPSSFAPKGSPKKNLYENLNIRNFSTPLETSNSGNIESVPVLEKHNINGEDDKITKGNNHNITKDNLKYLNDAVVTNVNSETVLPWNSSECHKIAYKDVLKNPSTSLLHSKPINNDTVEALLANTLPLHSTVRTNDIVRSTLDEKGLMYIREKLTNKYSNQENQGQALCNGPNFAKSLDSNNLLCKNTDFGLQNENISTNNERADKTGAITNIKYPGMLIPSKDKLQKMKQNIRDSGLIKAQVETTRTDSNLVNSDSLHSTGPFNVENLTENKLQNPSKVMENLFPLPASSSQTYLQTSDINNCQGIVNSFTTPSTTIHSEKLENQIFPYETNPKVKQSEHFPNMEHLRSITEELTIDSKSQKCQKCEEGFRVGDVAVITDKAKNAVWHPGCFTCSMCNELLADLVYFYYKNKLYCGRDLATLLGIPRCFACDELIFVREYTVAEGHNYHVKHFCCWDCDIPLAGKQYITENDCPLCLLCYQKTYAKTCNMCEKVIAADQQGVAVKDLNFHATEACFHCYICNKNLLNGKFAVKEKKIFCSKECISNFLHPQIK
ncbi:hypothetical protein K0M31_015535 [Melipona bicolor]|uniref:Testin n=1 Tax=Melipona bicolor TaxID=60889 RepID=A0AA40FG40_9HYME|nr:hypothetical protein K0M31_015535 [Melipona bicolor]